MAKRTKPQTTNNYPFKQVKDAGGGFARVEPFLTPDKIRNEFLFGIPLVSLITGQSLTDETIKSVIRRAANLVETECKIDVFPVQRMIRIDFDWTKQNQGFSHMKLRYAPVKSIEEVTIRLINSKNYVDGQLTDPNADQEGGVIYSMPLDWINLQAEGHRGVIYFTPLQTVYTGGYPNTGIGSTGTADIQAATIMSAINQTRWYPGFWAIKATFGFEDGSIPSPINELIACYASMEILSLIGATNWYSGKSIGIDGVSQSVSNPGPQVFATRMQDLKEKAVGLKDLIKKRFSGAGMFMQHI